MDILYRIFATLKTDTRIHLHEWLQLSTSPRVSTHPNLALGLKAPHCSSQGLNVACMNDVTA